MRQTTTTEVILIRARHEFRRREAAVLAIFWLLKGLAAIEFRCVRAPGDGKRMPDSPGNLGISGYGMAPKAKSSAKHHPWYLLVTLYGVPEAKDETLRAKNRVAWNRYVATKWHDNYDLAELADSHRYPAQELIP